MYGPLWIMISLFISVPVFGNFGQYLKAWQNDELDRFVSDISSIWKLVTWLIAYFFVLPYILHTCFKFGSGVGSIDSRYFFIASIYGYCF
jgi:hypothetical protein